MGKTIIAMGKTTFPDLKFAHRTIRVKSLSLPVSVTLIESEDVRYFTLSMDDGSITEADSLKEGIKSLEIIQKVMNAIKNK